MFVHYRYRIFYYLLFLLFIFTSQMLLFFHTLHSFFCEIVNDFLQSWVQCTCRVEDADSNAGMGCRMVSPWRLNKYAQSENQSHFNINKRYYIVLLMLLLFLCNNAAAQFVKISGQVTDFMGNPVAGATISFKGRKYSWESSSGSGNFSTIRNSLYDSVIICTHVNFKTIEQKIENAKTVNFKLYPNEQVNYIRPINDSLVAVIDSTGILDEQHFIDSFRAQQTNRIFTKVEMNPYFDGGEAALSAYYRVGLRNSKVPLKYSVNGVVTVGFIIKKDGSVSDVKLIKGINKQLDEAVIKLTEIMPKWRPALQNGRNYYFNYVLSIPINLKVKSM